MRAQVFILSLVFLACVSSFALGQKNKKSPVNPADTLGFHLPEELILGNSKYKTKHHYLLLGVGISGNGLKRTDGNFGLDYHMNIKGKYYQAGLMRSKELKGLFPTEYERIFYDLHFSMGKKLESVKMTYMALAGPSIITGRNHSNSSAYTSVGIQGQLQAIYKPFFDIGAGLSLYVNLNLKYSSAGARISLFFSNAYKGKVNEYLK
jgi:hypothetical protein